VAHSLLVVGSIAFDSIRTPHGEASDVLGGSATYFSVAASLFAPVRLVGVVGEDFPDAHRRVLESRRVDLAGLQVVEGGRTFRWAGTYLQDMNERRTDDVQLNVFGDFKPVIPHAWRETDLVFLANGSPVTQMSVLDQVTRTSLVVADTMDLWIETARDALVDLLAKIDGLVLNDGEARMLTGEQDLARAEQRILEWGPRFVVVKMGSQGARLAGRDLMEGCPSIVAPFLWCTANPNTFKMAQDNIDFYSGTVITDGEDPQEAGERLYRTVIDIASGTLSRSETLLHTDPIDLSLEEPRF